MLTEPRRMDEYRQNFNRDRKYKYQTETKELKIIITELKNTLEEFNRRLEKAEERISKNMWRLNNLLLNNQWVNEEIEEEI